jgi:xanthine dehydrogenase accessory factor
MLVAVRGAGDLASGIILKLYKCGFKVFALDIDKPTVIRRTVSFAEAILSGQAEVEGVKGLIAEGIEQVIPIIERGFIPVLVDPGGVSISQLSPIAVIDSIIAKRNLNTHRGMAPIVIGVGPGFEAPIDVDCVIETNRGHFLGNVIYNGKAEANTGIPGDIMGYTDERVLRSPGDGNLIPRYAIGDYVDEGDCLGTVDEFCVNAPISGILRGLIHPSVYLRKGMKIGDIDPRGKREFCFTVSDKARAIAGGVMEGLLHIGSKKGVLKIGS